MRVIVKKKKIKYVSFFYFCLKLKQVKILKIGIVILVQLYKIISRLFSYPFQRTLILAYLIFTSKPLGAFKNVDQILHNFDYLTTYPPRVDNCGQFTYYLVDVTNWVEWSVDFLLTTYLLLLSHVVIECPLALAKINSSSEVTLTLIHLPTLKWLFLEASK